MLLALVMLLGLPAVRPAAAAPPSPRSTLQPSVQIGISPHMFSELEKNDLISAINVWADSSLKRRGVSLRSKPQVFNSRTALEEGLKEDKADCLITLVEDFLALDPEAIDLDSLHFSSRNRSITEEYLLLVNRNSDIRRLADLRGKTVAIQSGFRESLAVYWLDTQLWQAGCSAAHDFFNKVEFLENPLKTVLPVFFGKVDACIVTRHTINTMIEANPQLSSRLRILRCSEPLVPALICTRRSYNPLLRNELTGAMRRMHTHAEGRDLLRLLAADRIVAGTPEALESSRALLRAYARLKEERGEG